MKLPVERYSPVGAVFETCAKHNHKYCTAFQHLEDCFLNYNFAWHQLGRIIGHIKSRTCWDSLALRTIKTPVSMDMLQQQSRPSKGCYKIPNY